MIPVAPSICVCSPCSACAILCSKHTFFLLLGSLKSNGLGNPKLPATRGEGGPYSLGASRPSPAPAATAGCVLCLKSHTSHTVWYRPHVPYLSFPQYHFLMVRMTAKERCSGVGSAEPLVIMAIQILKSLPC